MSLWPVNLCPLVHVLVCPCHVSCAVTLCPPSRGARVAGVTSQPGAFHPGQQGQCPGPPQLPPGLSLASLHSRGCMAPAFPATGLNGPRALPPPGTGWHLPLSGPPFQGNKPDPVAASCPCCEPTCGWAVVPIPLPRAGPLHRGHCQGARRAGGQASCGLAPTFAYDQEARSCRRAGGHVLGVTWQAAGGRAWRRGSWALVHPAAGGPAHLTPWFPSDLLTGNYFEVTIFWRRD